MLTREQRRQLEAEWSSDDRSIARFARLLKSGVLGIMVLGLLWIAGTGERQELEQQAAAPISRMQSDGSAMRASQQVYDERRAQWEGKPASLQRAASR
jgi:hypothetical protein